MKHDHQSPQSHPTNRRLQWVLIGFLVIAGYLLFTEHRAHLGGVLNYLPFLLLLACPLMHFFMHHGHGRHRDAVPPNDSQEEHR